MADKKKTNQIDETGHTMADKKKTNQIDETGHTVAENIKRLRGGQLLKDISEKLSKIGRHITPLALARIESKERKVDVDDLMAFAIVFNVSPLTLLLPNSGSALVPSKITGGSHEYGSNILWLWGRGDEPLEIAAKVGNTQAFCNELGELDYLFKTPREDGKYIDTDEYRNKHVKYSPEQEHKIDLFVKNARPEIDERKTGLLRSYRIDDWHKTDAIIKQGLKNTQWVSTLTPVDDFRLRPIERKTNNSKKSDEND
ncbi:helix-turn-helix transcriptional regulator [Gardnerella sp. DNF01192]|uniref:helix-turn-helix domain-containing protein n=1 Tax=Gardnerella sp. DNF01192 TaxID=2749064 RepID=UPI003BA99632